jgi:hypothetical protein
VAKGAADLDAPEEKEREGAKEREDAFEPLLKALAEHLKDEVSSVRLSSRLTASPACLVGETHSMTPQMEQLLRQMGQAVPKLQRILEVNPAHPVLERLQRRFAEGGSLGDVPELHTGSTLAEGGTLGSSSFAPSWRNCSPGIWRRRVGKRNPFPSLRRRFYGGDSRWGVCLRPAEESPPRRFFRGRLTEMRCSYSCSGGSLRAFPLQPDVPRG